ALMYGDGQGVPQDYQKAIEYYQKAADMGHAVAFLALGVLYENGQGVAQDYDKARRYFQKAVEIGDEEVKQLAQDFLNKL
ncbi:tetratricopeptide repeat protein, partial [Helicobacter felis]|uniref:tetratricopeptide repeat protein n=1 Tax=Helicobacter felis TaxID=214 RepID=UPI0013CE22E2